MDPITLPTMIGVLESEISAEAEGVEELNKVLNNV